MKICSKPFLRFGKGPLIAAIKAMTKNNSILLVLLLVGMLQVLSCDNPDSDPGGPSLAKVLVGDIEISLRPPGSSGLDLDKPISLFFSDEIDASTLISAVGLFTDGQLVRSSLTLLGDKTTVVLVPEQILQPGIHYSISVSDKLKGVNGDSFNPIEVKFETVTSGLFVKSVEFLESSKTSSGRIVDVSLGLDLVLGFSEPIDEATVRAALRLVKDGEVPVNFSLEDGGRKLKVMSQNKLDYLRKYEISIDSKLRAKDGKGFSGWKSSFFTAIDPSPKFPLISDDELMTKVQEQTFKYFWDFAHPESGMARERNSSGNLVTMGGSGFGVMSILVGIERGFITRQQGVDRLSKIVDFLERADRFHGAWPHWLDGNTGDVIPFSQFDNGGDLVETALMVQGLLTARAYLQDANPKEKAIKEKITRLWEDVEWDWYTMGGQNVLFWHWSPQHQWQMNLPIQGWNESLIVYVLAAASPTHPISKSVYDTGWARNGAMKNGKLFYNFTLPLGEDFGGPLFLSHYSFLGLDPRNLTDQYANYWTQAANHSRINREHCIQNPLGFVGYSAQSWGLTASDNHLGYSAHSPTNDLGVISPTAALSSMPFTPTESMDALQHFYYLMGDRLWGEFGFHDAFNVTEEWYADSYLAIDQGPIILMIENYRSGLLWKYFMQDAEVRAGLDKLNFNY